MTTLPINKRFINALSDVMGGSGNELSHAEIKKKLTSLMKMTVRDLQEKLLNEANTMPALEVLLIQKIIHAATAQAPMQALALTEWLLQRTVGKVPVIENKDEAPTIVELQKKLMLRMKNDD